MLHEVFRCLANKSSEHDVKAYTSDYVVVILRGLYMSTSSFSDIPNFSKEKTQSRLIKFIDSLEEGFELLELIYDKQGNVLDFVFLMVNPAYEKQTGLKAPDIVGKCKKEIAPASDQKWYDFAIQAVQTQRKFHYQYYDYNVNRFFETQFLPVSTTQIAVMFKDITERKKTETALRESEERLKIYLESTPAAVFVANPDGKYLFVNEGASRLLGYSKKEILNLSIPQVLCEESLYQGIQEFKKLKETGGSRSELCLKRKDGSPVYVILTATKLPDGNLIANCEDISERRELEKQLQDKERLAAIGTTAGMVGHDIRNPLQAMISDVYLLKDYLTAIPEIQVKKNFAESLEGIEKNIFYINKIVSDLQDYARRSEANYIDVNLYELVTSVFQPIDIPDNVNYSIEIDPYLQLKTDPALITRMLTNLIINALQAMPDGGKLNLIGYLKKDNAYIIVEDTGVGIPEEVKPKLFTPMMTTKAKGQGLGLAVVKRLVEAMNGKITFESEVDKGTKFIIELPAS